MQSQTKYWWLRAWTSFQRLKTGKCCLQASCSTCCWRVPCKGDDLMHAVLRWQSSQLCRSWWRTTQTLLRSYDLVCWNTWLPKGKLTRYPADKIPLQWPDTKQAGKASCKHAWPAYSLSRAVLFGVIVPRHVQVVHMQPSLGPLCITWPYSSCSICPCWWQSLT